MDYVKVASTADIPEGKMRQVELNGNPVLLANVGGAIHAIGGLCTHQKGVLADGTLEGHIVTCPRHGSQYDVRTGKNIRGPKVMGIRFKASDEPSFEVKIEAQEVLLKAD